MKGGMKMDEESIKYLEQYLTVTDKLKSTIELHASEYDIEPKICAWYKDMDDFYSDWCSIGYTKEQADRLLEEDSGEFMFLPENLGIIRYAL